MPDFILFEVQTRLGFIVQVSDESWSIISTIKHPVLQGKEISVRAALEDPDEIRRSRTDSKVFMFYRQERPNRWLCAVTKKLNGNGFLITAYPTDSIKEGDRIWKK